MSDAPRPFPWPEYDPADHTPGLSRSEATYEIVPVLPRGEVETGERFCSRDRDEAIAVAVEILRELGPNRGLHIAPYQFGEFSLDGYARLFALRGGDIELSELHVEFPEVEDGSGRKVLRGGTLSTRTSTIPADWIPPRAQASENPGLTGGPK